MLKSTNLIIIKPGHFGFLAFDNFMVHLHNKRQFSDSFCQEKILLFDFTSCAVQQKENVKYDIGTKT